MVRLLIVSSPPRLRVVVLPTVTPEVEARRASPLVAKMPPVMLVAPVKVLLPLSTQVPTPDLVTEVTPVLAAWSPMMLVSVLAPVFVPVRVKVRIPVSTAEVPAPLIPLKPIEPAPRKLRVSAEVAPEASKVAPPPLLSALPMLNRRFVLWAPLPEYLSVPPSSRRFVAVTAAAPRLPATPPLERFATTSVLPAPMAVISA